MSPDPSNCDCALYFALLFAFCGLIPAILSLAIPEWIVVSGTSHCSREIRGKVQNKSEFRFNNTYDHDFISREIKDSFASIRNDSSSLQSIRNESAGFEHFGSSNESSRLPSNHIKLTANFYEICSDNETSRSCDPLNSFRNARNVTTCEKLNKSAILTDEYTIHCNMMSLSQTMLSVPSFFAWFLVLGVCVSTVATVVLDLMVVYDRGDGKTKIATGSIFATTGIFQIGYVAYFICCVTVNHRVFGNLETTLGIANYFNFIEGVLCLLSAILIFVSLHHKTVIADEQSFISEIEKDENLNDLISSIANEKNNVKHNTALQEAIREEFSIVSNTKNGEIARQEPNITKTDAVATKASQEKHDEPKSTAHATDTLEEMPSFSTSTSSSSCLHHVQMKSDYAIEDSSSSVASLNLQTGEYIGIKYEMEKFGCFSKNISLCENHETSSKDSDEVSQFEVVGSEVDIWSSSDGGNECLPSHQPFEQSNELQNIAEDEKKAIQINSALDATSKKLRKIENKSVVKISDTPISESVESEEPPEGPHSISDIPSSPLIDVMRQNVPAKTQLSEGDKSQNFSESNDDILIEQTSSSER